MSVNYSEAQMDQRAPSIPSGKTFYDPLSPARKHVGPGHLPWGLWLNLTGRLSYSFVKSCGQCQQQAQPLWPYTA